MAAAAHPLPVGAVDPVDLTAATPSCSCVCAATAEPTATASDGQDGAADDVIPAGSTDDAAADGSTTGETGTSGFGLPRQISFSELLPDPVGKDTEGEFIEIRNEGADAVNLEGWSVGSTSEKLFTIPAATITGGSYLSFTYPETKIALTNTGATLTMRDRAGVVIDTVSYAETAKEGLSYAKNDAGKWSWTTALTPGTVNEFPLPTPATTDSRAAAAASSGTSAAATMPTESIIDGSAMTSAASSSASGITSSSVATAAISISEFLPNPTGADDDEWIELYNDGDGDVSLAGWTIDDADGGSKPFTLTTTEVVPRRGWLVLMRSHTGLALNNDGDSVRLFDAAGQAVEAIRYGNAAEGRSFKKTVSEWSWSDAPTPGAANIPTIDVNEAKISDEDVTSGTTFSVEQTAPENGSGTDGPAAPPAVDIAELAELENGATAIVSGIVNIPGGRIGKTLVGLQNEKGTAGIIARFYGTDLPATALGQLWTVSGRVSRLGDEIRIAVKTRDAVLNGQQQMTAEPRAVADISEADAGLYLSIAGLITGSGKYWLSLAGEDGVGEIRISLPEGRGTAASAKGERAKAVGTLRYRQGRPELVVVAKDGLEIVPRPVTEGLNLESSEAKKTLSERPPLVLTPPLEKSPHYAAYGSIAALAAAAGLSFVWWKRRRYSEMPE